MQLKNCIICFIGHILCDTMKKQPNGGRLAHFFNIIVLNNALLLNHNSFYQMEYLSHCFSTIASWQRFFLIIPPHLVLPSCPLTHSTEL